MLICFSAWKGSGKDTAAEYLINKYGAVRVALADPLKDMAAEEFGIDRVSLDDPKRKESPILTLPVDPKDAYSKMIAEFLVKEFRTSGGLQAKKFVYYNDQFCGDTETGYGICKLYWTPRALAILKGSTNRSVRSDYWVNQAFKKIDKLLEEGKTVVLTDLRYKSELSQFKEHFGDKFITVRVNRFTESPSNDPSERDLDDAKFDHYIDNTGTLENLYVQVEALFGQLVPKSVS